MHTWLTERTYLQNISIPSELRRIPSSFHYKIIVYKLVNKFIALHTMGITHTSRRRISYKSNRAKTMDYDCAFVPALGLATATFCFRSVCGGQLSVASC